MAVKTVGIKGINGLPLVDEEARRQIANINTSGGGNTNIANPFAGKKWAVFGDSISQPTSAEGAYPVEKYHDYIGRNLGIEVTSYAVGGSGYLKGAATVGYGANNVIDKISQADTGFDIVSIMAGIGDKGQTLGELTDPTPTGEPTTVYGAVRVAIEAAIEKYPLAQIFIITPTPATGTDATPKQGKLAQIAKAQAEVAKIYNIPVVDLYHESGLRPWNTDNHTKYYRDYCHLLTGGHEYISKIIQKFMQDKLSI